MRVTYTEVPERFWTQYYAQQSRQHGAGFIGSPYQRGGGLGSLFRGIFRALLPVAKSAGKAIGKQALSTGAEIASDIVAGKGIKEAAKRRGKAGTAALLRKAATKLQRGKGIGRRPKRLAKKKKKKKAGKKTKFTDQLGLYYK